MNQENIEELKVVLDILEPTSDLHKSQRDAIAHLSEVTYLIVGQSPSGIYDNEGFEALLKMAKTQDIDGCIDIHNHWDSPFCLVEIIDGWMGYSTITEDEYNQLDKAIEEFQKECADKANEMLSS